MMTKARRSKRWRLLVSLAAVSVLAAAAFWLWPRPASVDGGTPRLEVDRAEIDLGTVALDRWVTATFNVRNAGDGTLVISSLPKVYVVRGC